ncbi:tetraacyldisaccharide 4'-kinase [Capsulimonas corticalis]|uniref:Tetraacyldisaccharide 4'-kinase n=1 Tax=Capsulimonas corticalis TaxID=2219043 RepID=A0A402CPC6_9BACT|nr:tetraacyldisaccharide 4'-kinase [Capsulimonas corticalis]BDI33051.1 tetraacyldisaccharide 4'-kinase [Capsulimonas corticalis]
MSSRLEQYLLKTIAVEDPARGVAASITRGALGGLASLYDGGLELYLGAERFGVRKRARLPIPVISVGNLSVGGAGKTPMTAFLANRLTADGRRIAILSRGHGGESQEARHVSEGDGSVLMTAAQAGDEPVLLAELCPRVPVLVGKDRRLSGREALRRHALDAFVLDDGFQFWQLERDLDIVLLDARRPFDNGYPLPRGLLREPKRHLSRAGIVVATRADRIDSDGRAALAAEVTALNADAPLFFATHAPSMWLSVGQAPVAARPLEEMRGARVIAVSAIAQPESFRRTLLAAGVEIVTHIVRDDHYPFTENDIQAAEEERLRSGADAIVMTEKDAVKWSAVSAGGSCPAYALRIAMAIEDEARFMKEIERRVFTAAPNARRSA